MRRRAVGRASSLVAFGSAAGTVSLVCMALPALAAAGNLAIGLFALSLGFGLVLLSSLGWHALGHVRLVRRLQALSAPALQAGVPVRELAGTDGPFVAGLRRPTIYSPPTLPERLHPHELKAVLLHEQCHLADLAPARLLLLSVIASLVPLRSVQRWAEVQRARLEIDADRYAIQHGTSPVTLASALLKLGGQPAPYAASFASSAELRLRALLGESPRQASPGLPGWRPLTAGLGFGAGCLALYLS